MHTKTILIAEDDKTVLRMLQARLEREGYTIQAAVDGQQAMDLIQKKMPDLVITDLMMPFKSGLEVTEAIKEQNESVPVIVLSAAGQESTVMDAFNIGADDFMDKPFNPSELIVRIKRLLK